jgi:hypothetical protein
VIQDLQVQLDLPVILDPRVQLDPPGQRVQQAQLEPRVLQGLPAQLEPPALLRLEPRVVPMGTCPRPSTPARTLERSGRLLPISRQATGLRLPCMDLLLEQEVAPQPVVATAAVAVELAVEGTPSTCWSLVRPL